MQSPLKRPGSGETSSEDDHVELEDDNELADLADLADLDKSRRWAAAPAPSPTSTSHHHHINSTSSGEEDEEEEAEGDGDAAAGGGDEFDGGQEDEELVREEEDDDDGDDHVPYPDAQNWLWNDYLKRWLRRSEDHQGLGEFEPEPCVSICCRCLLSLVNQI